MIYSAISKLSSTRSDVTHPHVLSTINLSLLRELVLYDINNLKYSHAALCEICHNIGGFYGLTFFIVIIFSIKGIVISLYFVIVSLLCNRLNKIILIN